MPELEERMARIEGILEQVSDQLNHLEARIQALDNKLDSSIRELRGEMSSGMGELRGEIRELRAQMGMQFRWIVGLIMVTWITVMVAVLFK